LQSSKLQKVQEEIQDLVKRIHDAEGIRDFKIDVPVLNRTIGGNAFNYYLFHFHIALENADNGDSLDDYMNTMSQRMDKQTKIKLKRNIVELKKVCVEASKQAETNFRIDLSSFGRVFGLRNFITGY
jgi:hypothetical protein